MRSIRSVALLCSTAALAAHVPAFADSRVGADVQVTGGYSTNPFSAAGGDAGSAMATASFLPFIDLVSPAGNTRLSGEVTRTEYARRYDGQTDYAGGVSTRLQASPRTAISGNANYSSRVINALNPILNPLNPLPGDPNLPVIVDPATLGSFQQRTKMLSGGVQVQHQLTARDSLSFGVNGAAVRYGATSLPQSNYDYYGGNVGYQRSISAYTAIGVSMGANRTLYKQAGFGNTTSFSPSATLQTRLSPTLSINAAAGVTFTDTDIAGASRKFTAFSGSISLCKKGDRSNLCAQASRSVAPSAFNGVSTQTSAGLNYSYTLDPRSQITASASYSRQAGVAGISNVQTFDFGYASLGYSRQVTRRLSAVATLSYSDSFNSIAARPANFYGSVGLRYRLGDIR